MKIAIVAPSPIPFLIGGAEKFLWGLQKAVNQLSPHDAELIKVPCRDQEFWPLMEAYQRFYRLDLGYFDKVISTKYPAWMVRHPDHDVYMQHACRGVYDLYPRCGRSTVLPRHRALAEVTKIMSSPRPDDRLLETFFSELFALRQRRDLPRGVFDFPGPLTRAVIHFLDRAALSDGKIKKYFAISQNVIKRDGYFPPQARVEVIHHPTDIDGLYSRSYDYLFTASRLEDLKRVDLLIKAFKRVKADIPFKIAGTGGREERLRLAAAADERIEFLGFVTDEELVDCYAGALFVPFIPYDEDYGLITLEAKLSAKAVLTTSDAGGVTELVTHGSDGLITEPTAGALAAAMGRLIENREETVRMGKAARKNARDINWENTVARLLGQAAAGPARGVVAGPGSADGRNRIKIVMVNDYPVCPPISGGQKRIYHLCRNLAGAGARVTLATLGSPGEEKFRRRIEKGAIEITYPRSPAQKKAERKLNRQLKASANDIAVIDGFRLSPGFLLFLEQICLDAELVICAHPYLFKAIREVWEGPLWLDAHNVEADMKDLVLPASAQKKEAIKRVVAVERACLREADLVCCVSEADQARFESLYGPLPETLVVPNGMDFSAPGPVEEAKRSRLRQRLELNAPTAVFIGSNHGPNNRALEDLCKIAERCGEVCFLITGAVCESMAAKNAPNNMRLLGVLSEGEKNVVFRAAHLALNPVTQGGGTNLKTIEYMAYRLPVLTTPCGIRGFEAETKGHVRICELEDFPEALREMLSPAAAEKMREMVHRAYLHARDRYDWTVACEPLIKQMALRFYRP